MEQHDRGDASGLKRYRTPRLTVHGSIAAITETGSTRKVEKHPLDFKKGSKIRP